MGAAAVALTSTIDRCSGGLLLVPAGRFLLCAAWQHVCHRGGHGCTQCRDALATGGARKAMLHACTHCRGGGRT